MRSFVAVSVLLSLFAITSAQFGFLGNFFGGGNRGNRGNRGNGNRGNGNRGNNNGGGGGGCRNSGPNHSWGGRNYILTWQLGCRSFTHQGADQYCRSQGMRAISLDNGDKARHFMDEVFNANEKYFWTGGNMINNQNAISWPSGAVTNVNDARAFFSNTGGANRPQPDNREGDEFCLAVLNNFYNDGVRYHDVSCHHTKPTICEG